MDVSASSFPDVMHAYMHGDVLFLSMPVITQVISIFQEGEQYAKENGLSFLETSAKSAQNVNELFYEIGNFMALNVIFSV